MLQIGITLWLLLRTLIAEPEPRSVVKTPVDFAKDVRPILEKRCQPCHFTGGTMYEHLPFDQPATIDKLGTKLFTRIKREEEQAVIRAFLARKRG